MRWRRIAEEEVVAVVADPDEVKPTAKGRLNALKKLGNRYLQVTFREADDEIVVITVVDKAD